MANLHKLQEPIAIIGVSCSVPGANSESTFWKNLLGGKVAIANVNDIFAGETRIRRNLCMDPGYVGREGGVDDVEFFDARHFKVSPSEAKYLDPQLRMFLQHCYFALSNAGVSPSKFKGDIGVFASKFVDTYMLHSMLENETFRPGDIRDYIHALELRFGNEPDYLSSFVSYRLGLTGPSVSVYTACSSSLVAIHAACNSIRCGESDVAIAGGVSLKVPQYTGYICKSGQFFSKTGYCRPFSDEADGTVFSNGLGVVVLKDLKAAIESGDNIQSVILGSAVNNDGARKVGYSAPSYQGHRDVIEKCLRASGVSPEQVEYIEAHGTGTYIGDPVEYEALNKVYGAKDRVRPCAIGSVKETIGHLRNAAGVVGLIKLSNVLKHGVIPGTESAANPNKCLNIEDSSLYLPPENTYWDTPGGERIGAISSLGVGGTNVHALLCNYSDSIYRRYYSDCNVVDRRSYLTQYFIPVSAKSEQSLLGTIDDLAQAITPEMDIADVSYTLTTGRCDYKYRCAFISRNSEELKSAILDIGQHAVSGVNLSNSSNTMFFSSAMDASCLMDVLDDMQQHDVFCKHFYQGLDHINAICNLSCGSSIRNIDDIKNRLDQGIFLLIRVLYRYSLLVTFSEIGIRFNYIIGDQDVDLLELCFASKKGLYEALVEAKKKVDVMTNELIVGHGRRMLSLTEAGVVADVGTARECVDWHEIILQFAPRRDTCFFGDNLVFHFLKQEQIDAIHINSVERELKCSAVNSFVAQLANYWVVGGCVEWEPFWQSHKVKKIMLPALRLSPKRHWL